MTSRIECTCPEDHTITKLGHCRTCYYVDDHKVVIEVPPGHSMTGSLSVFLCGPTDPTHEHDYSWATYSDETESYGVCQCRFNSMMEALWNGP